MRVVVVIECDLPHPDDITETLLALDPKTVPHFAGVVRVAIDPTALTLLDWLDEKAPLPPNESETRMFTTAFWTALGERAVKTFAQALVAAIGATAALGAVDWSLALQVAGLATLLSALTSVGSSAVGGAGPSLGAEVLAPAPPAAP